MDMAGLAFYVEQLPITAHQALHATLTTAPDVGLFHPFSALIPEEIESVLGGQARSCCTLLCHLLPLAQYVNSPHGIERQKVDTFLNTETCLLKFFFYDSCR
ncbi:hypothetical protein D9M73_174460 [compost metagenome]